MIVWLDPLIGNIDVIFSPRTIVGGVGKVFQEIVSATAVNKIGRNPETRRDCDPSPPERDHQPRDRHGRSDDLQNHQDRLLPGGERAQVQCCQTGPGCSADA